MRKCICGKEIPAERLEALPDTPYCVGCAAHSGSARRGFMVFGHKTAPELVMIPETNVEGIRQAERANRRSR